jgi:glycosyltransferase involved in cell wall biosynthesis
VTKFSICIPNYNYGRYIGRTIQSVLAQEGHELEVLVSDNASTDDSVAVIEAIDDPRIQLSVNHCNAGFCGNLDRAARMATGEVVIMLSSDDLMQPGALDAYAEIFASEQEAGRRAVVTSAVYVTDADDQVTGYLGPDETLWGTGSDVMDVKGPHGSRMRIAAADRLLRRCLETMRNPFNFAATAYLRTHYEEVEGYGGARLMNPDKWFHWRLLGQADVAYFVEAPLFSYRWHSSNQTAIHSTQRSLAFLIDDYVNTFDIAEAMLARAGLSREDVVGAFVEYDIARHGLATLARGDRSRARRISDFGRATYPQQSGRNRKALALRLLLGLGPIGEQLAARAYRVSNDRRPELESIRWTA